MKDEWQKYYEHVFVQTKLVSPLRRQVFIQTIQRIVRVIELTQASASLPRFGLGFCIQLGISKTTERNRLKVPTLVLCDYRI
jgi:hypothetical protein